MAECAGKFEFMKKGDAKLLAEASSLLNSHTHAHTLSLSQMHVCTCTCERTHSHTHTHTQSSDCIAQSAWSDEVKCRGKLSPKTLISTPAFIAPPFPVFPQFYKLISYSTVNVCPAMISDYSFVNVNLSDRQARASFDLSGSICDNPLTSDPPQSKVGPC